MTQASGDGLDHLFQPRSVAVIGASADAARIGGRSIAYMLARGFEGAIYPVNPNRAEVQGLKAYASVASLPAAPDVGIVVVPAPAVVQAVRDLGARGCGTAIVFSSGFAEVGAAGGALQADMIEAARAHNMRVLGPNTLGVFDPRANFYGTFAAIFEGGFAKRGGIGIASQSGAYGGHLYTLARARGLGLAACVMTGNEADITVGDAIARMVTDPDIDVIAAYAEGINNPDKLLAALEAARRAHKPVVFMKVGRSVVGGLAAQSHTASIAGDDAVFECILDECGAVRARNTEEMLDIAHLATRKVYPVGNTLGVFTISGGAGVLISDAAEALGLPMPPMPAVAQARLKSHISFCSAVNPVDCTAQIVQEVSLISTFGETMMVDGGYRSLLSFFTYTGASSTFGPQLRGQLAALRRKHPDRLFALSIIAPREVIAEYEADGLTVFEDPSRALAAIHAMGRFGEAFARPPRAVPLDGAVMPLPSVTPNEAEAKRMLANAGIATSPEELATSAAAAVTAAARLGFPVVMKVVSADIMHKSEMGGVLLGVDSADAVRTGFATLQERAKVHAPAARIDGILVAKQLTGGVECILGIKRDAVFGPIVLFGLGGLFVEYFDDVQLRRCPVDEREAEAMIRAIKGAPLLLGARGRLPADITALARMLSRLSQVAVAAGPRLAAIDLNPVLAMPAGQGAIAVDAVIEIREPG